MEELAAKSCRAISTIFVVLMFVNLNPRVISVGNLKREELKIFTWVAIA